MNNFFKKAEEKKTVCMVVSLDIIQEMAEIVFLLPFYLFLRLFVKVANLFNIAQIIEKEMKVSNSVCGEGIPV